MGIIQTKSVDFMRHLHKITFTALLTLLLAQTKAQGTISNAERKYSIALFAPLFLDSVFYENKYRYGKKFPRFALQGIDFIQGAQIALDSFPLENTQLETFIFDTKSDTLSIETLIKTHQLDNLDLIIGSVKDQDLLLLAAFAKDHTIPFISATYPNDGGITNNPYFIIVNPTLQSHCEALFSYLLQNNDEDNILLINKIGSQEDRAADYINNINKPDKKPLLTIQTITIDSNFNLIINKLDSTKNNVIIGGSLEENFVVGLCNTIKSLPKIYKITLFGMPNWSGFGAFGKNSKSTIKDIPFYFTTPFYYEKSDSISNTILNAYTKMYKGHPTDFAFKGFEMMYFFSRLLTSHTSDFYTNLNNQKVNIFSNFNFMPIIAEPSHKRIDYYENKHLFFIKRVDGKNYKAW